MHGRLKVKTTEQQKAERKAEKAAQAAKYQEAVNFVLANRRNDKLREKILKVTASVLQGNPDLTTFWNIRKETMERYIEEKTDVEEMDQILQKETELTQQCLMVNPKSYGAWYHRRWCLERQSSSNWEKELALCARYLQMDERNFHCWDYRRYIAKKAGVTPENDLKFAMDRINANFSNYSAWHLRSKILPLIYPKETGDIGVGAGDITDAKRKEEIDLIQHAIFTDPEDSSAWFYHTWLLGKDPEQEEVKLLAVERRKNVLAVVFSKPVSSPEIKVRGVEGQEIDNIKWTSAPGAEKDFPCEFQKIWMAKENCDSVSKVEFQSQILNVNEGVTTIDPKELNKGQNLGEETRAVLMEDLSNCQELIELEPDSKWTKLSIILIMKSLDEYGFHEEIIQNLEEMCQLDPKRKGFYQDLRSKAILKRKLDSIQVGGSVDLSNLGLSSLYFPERLAFVSRLNLSGNPSLKSNIDNLRSTLLHCEVIEKNDREIDVKSLNEYLQMIN